MNVMKKIIKLFVAFIIVINVTVSASGNVTEKEGSELTVTQKSHNLYNVIYKGSGNAKVSIKFIDSNKKVLYSESITAKRGFTVPLNLKNLPAGNYILKLESASDTLSEEIAVLSPEELYSDLISVKCIGEKQFTLLVDEEISNSTDSSLDLFIKDKKGEILHQGQVSFSDSKVYDLKKLVGDEATFMFYDGQDMVKEQQVKL